MPETLTRYQITVMLRSIQVAVRTPGAIALSTEEEEASIAVGKTLTAYFGGGAVLSHPGGSHG